MNLSRGLESFLKHLRTKQRAAGEAPGSVEALELRRMLSVHAAATGPDHKDETDNSNYTLHLSGSADGLTPNLDHWSVNWGDGTSTSYAASSSMDVQHSYLKDGTHAYNIAATLYAVGGTYTASTYAGKTVTIDDVAPMRSLAIQNTGDFYAQETILTLTRTYSDVTLDPATSWFIDWGDGSDPDHNGYVGETFSGNPNTFLHQFDTGGSYDISGSVTNKDGVFGAAPTNLLVANKLKKIDQKNPLSAGSTSINEQLIAPGSNWVYQSLLPLDQSGVFIAVTLDGEAKASGAVVAGITYSFSGYSSGQTGVTITVAATVAKSLHINIKIFESGNPTGPYNFIYIKT